CTCAVVSVVRLAFCAILLISLGVYAFPHCFALPRVGKMVLASIAVPFVEEAFWRKIVLGLLLRTVRKYMAIFAVSVIFAAVHFLKAPERTSEIVTWTSGFSSIGYAFNGIAHPMMLASAFATLFVI